MKRGYFVNLALVFLFTLGLFLFIFSNYHKEGSIISISANPWIGYTPFVYAQEKGWLDETPFKFLWLVDLSDNLRLYKRGFTKGFSATQYELLKFDDKNHIKPAFLIDKSCGADVIVSNYNLDELKELNSTIEVYMELGSLHEDFFDSFIKENHLESLKFKKIDASQKSISSLKLDERPKIALSYYPYLNTLFSSGFKNIASTRTLQNFLVIDALFVEESLLKSNRDDFIKLKNIFDLAVNRLQEDPKEYYNTIKGYLENQSYDEFIKTLQDIEWLNDKLPPKVIEHLELQNIATDGLVK